MNEDIEKFLLDYKSPVAADAINVVESQYSDLSPEIKIALALEITISKLDGIYSLFIIATDNERSDEAYIEIREMCQECKSLFSEQFNKNEL